MTGQLIFKMELFKFLKDKSYLITAGILGVLNIGVTAYFLRMVSNVESYYYGYDETVLISMMFLAIFVILGNWIFIFIYPFHILSSDYKNNVMAMMIASGVNRKKLFFAKIGAVALCTVIVTLMVSLIPAILLMAKLGQYVSITEMLDYVMKGFRMMSVSGFQLFLWGVLSYLTMLVLMSAACILLKGSNLTFLVFIGFNFLINFANSFLMGIADAFDMNFNGYVYFQLFLYLVYILVFGFISLKTLQRQNL